MNVRVTDAGYWSTSTGLVDHQHRFVGNIKVDTRQPFLPISNTNTLSSMSIDPLSIYFQTELKLGQSEPTQRDSKVPSQIAVTTSTSTSTSASAELPYSFVIGKSTLSKQLVTTSSVKGHLHLLHRFSELKPEVNYLPFFSEFRGWPTETRWRYFISVAVERCVYLEIDH